ncbi:hypothetical protein B1812_00010 [Methylocystis bryophila]|uniref:Uncharacterized protein n=2 Tax=Methylocystis bryophila TaxID=655015 RepID=A0A1W6N086_9HYPH|nr:hypothetical protein B1812_00010 [Methylocystis bryophila]
MERRDREHGRIASLQVSLVPALIVAVLALAGMAVIFLYDARIAAGGWLTALVLWSGIAIGCLFALMIHTLTGGRWGTRFAPALFPAAMALPLIAALFAPILVELKIIYPWAYDPASTPSDVSQLYLNIPFYIARSLGALFFWTIMGLLLTRVSGGAAVLVAAIGLGIHGLIIGLIGLDWILSLEPAFISTSFGATLAFTQFAAALAWAAIISPTDSKDPALADIGGLLLATLLGITYLNFIAVLVIWYGNLPQKALFLVRRDEGPWMLIGVLAFALGSVFPIFSLFLERVRSSALGLRCIGAVALVGIALYDAYLIAPSFGVLSLASALVASTAVGALFVAFLSLSWAKDAHKKWSAARAR